MERINLVVPDGTRERIKALGVPGGPADFLRWALENALQEQERYKRGEQLPSSYPGRDEWMVAPDSSREPRSAWEDDA